MDQENVIGCFLRREIWWCPATEHSPLRHPELTVVVMVGIRRGPGLVSKTHGLISTAVSTVRPLCRAPHCWPHLVGFFMGM